MLCKQQTAVAVAAVAAAVLCKRGALKDASHKRTKSSTQSPAEGEHGVLPKEKRGVRLFAVHHPNVKPSIAQHRVPRHM